MSSNLTSACHSASLAANTAWAAAEGPAWSVFLPSLISRRSARRRSRVRGNAGGVMGRQLSLCLAGPHWWFQLLIGRHSRRTTCTSSPDPSKQGRSPLSGARAYGLPQIGGLAQVTEPPSVISPPSYSRRSGRRSNSIQREPRSTLDGHHSRRCKGFMKLSFAPFMPMQSQKVATPASGATPHRLRRGLELPVLLLGACSADAPTAP